MTVLTLFTQKVVGGLLGHGLCPMPTKFEKSACHGNPALHKSPRKFVVKSDFVKSIGVTQLDVGAAAKPPARAVLTPYKGCFRADCRPPLHKMTSTA